MYFFSYYDPELDKRGVQDTSSLHSRRSSRRDRLRSPGIENPVYDDDKFRPVHNFPANKYELPSTSRKKAVQNLHKTGRPPLTIQHHRTIEPKDVEIVNTPLDAIETLKYLQQARQRDSSDFYDESEFDDYDYEHVTRGQQQQHMVQLTQHKPNRPIQSELKQHAIYASAAAAGATWRSDSSVEQPIYSNVETLKIRGDSALDNQQQQLLDHYRQSSDTRHVEGKEADAESVASNNSSEVMRNALAPKDNSPREIILTNEHFCPNITNTSTQQGSDSSDSLPCRDEVLPRKPAILTNLRRIDSMEDIRNDHSYLPSRGAPNRVSINRARSMDDLLEDKNVPNRIITVPGLHKYRFKSTPLINLIGRPEFQPPSAQQYDIPLEHNQRHSVAMVEHANPAQHISHRIRPLEQNLPRESPVAVLKPQRRPTDIYPSDSPPLHRSPYSGEQHRLQKHRPGYGSTSVLNSQPRYIDNHTRSPQRYHSADNLLQDNSPRRDIPPESPRLYNTGRRYASSPNVASTTYTRTPQPPLQEDPREHIEMQTSPIHSEISETNLRNQRIQNRHSSGIYKATPIMIASPETLRIVPSSIENSEC